MARQPNQSPMPIRGLLALEYMVDHDVIALTKTSLNQTPPTYLKRPTKEVPRGELPQGAPEMDSAVFESLRVRGCLDHPDAAEIEAEAGLHKRVSYIDRKQVAEQKEPMTPFAWYDRPHAVNDAGRATLEKGRERIAEWRREQAAKEDEFVVVRRKDKPGVGAFCQVVRRTEKRVYVKVVESLDHVYSPSVVEGYGDNRYVAVDDVFAEGVAVDAWRRLKDATVDHDDALKRAKDALQAKLAPIYAEHEGRTRQIAACFEDEIRELLAPGPTNGPR